MSLVPVFHLLSLTPNFSHVMAKNSVNILSHDILNMTNSSGAHAPCSGLLIVAAQDIKDCSA